MTHDLDIVVQARLCVSDRHAGKDVGKQREYRKLIEWIGIDCASRRRAAGKMPRRSGTEADPRGLVGSRANGE